MRSVSRKRKGPTVGIRTLLALLLLIVAVGATAQQPRKPVLISFGVGLGERAMAPQELRFESRASTAFRKALEGGKEYRIVPFSRTHPSVQRALLERTLPSELLLPPFTGTIGTEFKVVRLAKVMRGEFAVSVVVDRLTFSDDGKRVSAVLIYEVYDVEKAKMVGTAGATLEASGADQASTADALIQALSKKGAEDTLAILEEYLKKPPGK